MHENCTGRRYIDIDIGGKACVFTFYICLWCASKMPNRVHEKWNRKITNHHVRINDGLELRIIYILFDQIFPFLSLKRAKYRLYAIAIPLNEY